MRNRVRADMRGETRSEWSTIGLVLQRERGDRERKIVDLNSTVHCVGERARWPCGPVSLFSMSSTLTLSPIRFACCRIKLWSWRSRKGTLIATMVTRRRRMEATALERRLDSGPISIFSIDGGEAVYGEGSLSRRGHISEGTRA
jgi:hypothetical protein